MEFNKYRNSCALAELSRITMERILTEILSDERLKERTEIARKFLRKEGSEEAVKAAREEYREYKLKNFPMITVHACFTGGGRKQTDPHTYYGHVLIDVDHISEEKTAELRDVAWRDRCCSFFSRSVSGQGVHAFIPVTLQGEEMNDANFKEIYRAAAFLIGYYWNAEVDHAVGSISRTMFLNHDAEAFYKPEATPLDVTTPVWLERVWRNFNSLISFNNMENLKKYLDEADAHLNWSEGNRHATLVSLAGTLNKAGFDAEDVLHICCARYIQNGFDRREIEETVRDIYKRYPEQHGVNGQQQMDKTTNGHIVSYKTSQEISAESLEEACDDPDMLLKTPVPDVEAFRPYMLDNTFDYIVDNRKPREIQFVSLMSAITAMGAIIPNATCWLDRREGANPYIFFNVVGAQASGKSAIEIGRIIFSAHAQKIEAENRMEIEKQKAAKKAWEKREKKCKDEESSAGPEPKEVPQVKLLLSPNISKNKFIWQLQNNGDYPTFLYTTEIGNVLDTREYRLTDAFRQVLEGESLSSHTIINGDHGVRQSKVAMLFAGTPQQQALFYRNKEDGLTSRTLFCFIPSLPYIGLSDFVEEDGSLSPSQREEILKRRVLSFSAYFTGKNIDMKLDHQGRKMLDDYFSIAEQRYGEFASDSFRGAVKRLRKNNVRIAMILTAIQMCNENQAYTGSVVIPHDILSLVISLNDFFLEQQIRALDLLPEIPIIGGKEMQHAAVYNALPSSFTSAEAIKIFTQMTGMSAKSATRWLKLLREVKKLRKHGRTYYKIEADASKKVG